MTALWLGGWVKALWGGFRRITAPLWIRLLAFNLLLVFLPVVGISYLDVYERQLLAAQERRMAQQGQVFAAALAVTPGELPETAARAVERLGQRTTARIRVLDREGRVLADSSQATPPAEGAAPELYRDDEGTRDRLLYRLGRWLFRIWSSVVPPPSQELETAPSTPGSWGPEVDVALQGRYGAATRISPGQRSVTLFSALPIENGTGVVGVVLVSQSTLRILQDLYEVRLAVFRVVLASLALGAALSLLVSTTIVRPLHRLRREANEIVDRRGRLRGTFRGSRRRDEIGDLSRALEALSRRLEGHLRFLESFAADVSHEFRNPLATVRSSVEVLSDARGEEDRERLTWIALREIARLERLLDSVREITHIDAASGSDQAERIRPASVLEALTVLYRDDRPETPVVLETDPELLEAAVEIAPDRLVQVLRNLIENALDFSPPGRPVTLSLETGAHPRELAIAIRDEGPGIPVEHRERIFDRFFSFRPGSSKGDHAGLGLAIVQALVERGGGRIELAESPAGGAEFRILLPRLPD